MRIERIEDKKFLCTLTESEALKLADHTEMDFHLSRLVGNRIGARLLHYMIESCRFPHTKRPTLELETISDGH